jgi:SAM-dependent methyltransferase
MEPTQKVGGVLVGHAHGTCVCPGCGLVAQFLTRRQVNIYSCPACGLAFGEATDDVVATPAWYFHDSSGEFSTQAEVARRRVPLRKRYYERILGRPVKRVLEIGCGHAAWAGAWQELGCDYVGVEYEPEVAAEARALTGAEIVGGNFTRVDIQGVFDVIFLSQVLEHVGNPIEFLGKARSLGALIHVDVPNHASVMSLLRMIAHPREYGFIQPPHHLLAYTPKSLRKLFVHCGFRPVEIKPFRNNHKIFGQLAKPGVLSRLIYAISDVMGRGSLLVGVALSH